MLSKTIRTMGRIVTAAKLKKMIGLPAHGVLSHIVQRFTGGPARYNDRPPHRRHLLHPYPQLTR